MARATATRCCCPPDICAGKPIPQPLQTDLVQDRRASAPCALRRRHTLDLHHELDVLAGGQHRDQVVGLKDEADLVQPHRGQLALAEVVDPLAPRSRSRRCRACPDHRSHSAASSCRRPTVRRDRRSRPLSISRSTWSRPVDLDLPLAIGLAQIDAAYGTHRHTFVMASTGS